MSSKKQAISGTSFSSYSYKQDEYGVTQRDSYEAKTGKLKELCGQYGAVLTHNNVTVVTTDAQDIAALERLIPRNAPGASQTPQDRADTEALVDRIISGPTVRPLSQSCATR
jgi:hypothetical protein